MADPVDAARESMNALRGRLFQTVEAVGFPEQQTSAIKGLIRHATYEAQRDIEQAIRRDRA